MKASVIGLVLIGFVAAASAAVLVFMMKTGLLGSREELSAEVDVVVASVDLEAMSVIQADGIATHKVKREEAPPGFISNPVQAIGRVLSLPVTAGQALTRSNFAAEGTGIQFASALKSGMRAVSVSLTDYSSLSGLLYPGCVVDVLAYLKPTYQAGGQMDPISMTILKGIQVLGVEDQTIVSTEKDADPKAPQGDSPPSKRWMVTLLVKPKDAQTLQLAMENGRISLSMRNPLDSSVADNEPMTSLTEILKGSPSKRVVPWSLPGVFQSAGAAPEVNAAALGSAPSSGAAPRPGGKLWDVQVIRGSENSTVSFPMLPARQR